MDGRQALSRSCYKVIVGGSYALQFFALVNGGVTFGGAGCIIQWMFPTTFDLARDGPVEFTPSRKSHPHVHTRLVISHPHF